MAAAKSATRGLVPRFPFPKKSVLRPVVPPISLPVAVRKDPKYHRLEPSLKHSGVKWMPSSWSKGKFKGGKQVERMSRKKWQTLRQQGLSTLFVAPDDRIRQWNIGPGDRVRILRGDDEMMWVDPKVGRKSGWKIHEVKKIDQRTSRVFLFEKKDPDPQIRPHEWKDWTPQRRAEWLQEQDRLREEKNRRSMSDSFHYSDVSLLMVPREDAAHHIWAKRTRSSAPRWDENAHSWTWDRFAVYRDPLTGKRGVAKIKWPLKKHSRANHEAGATETKDTHITTVTLNPRTGDELFDHNAFIERLLPQTLRSPLPFADDHIRWAADEYIRRTTASEALQPGRDDDGFIDLIMPLYIGEELSPRFAKWKKDLAFQQRSALFKQQKTDFIEKAVDEWEAGGKDRHLREVMDSPQASLAGVPIRPRTRKEVIQTAELEYKSVLAQELRDKAREIKRGKRWNYEEEKWQETDISMRRERKLRRKKAKEVRKLQRLDTLQLKESRNQVLPPELKLNREGTAPVRASA